MHRWKKHIKKGNPVIDKSANSLRLYYSPASERINWIRVAISKCWACWINGTGLITKSILNNGGELKNTNYSWKADTSVISWLLRGRMLKVYTVSLEAFKDCTHSIFLDKLTGWNVSMCFHDWEAKSHFVEICHPITPRPKKFKNQRLGQKDLMNALRITGA